MSIFSLVHEDAVKAALKEDLGHGRDITSQLLIPYGTQIKANMNAREGGILAGIELAEIAYKLTCSKIKLTRHINDGETLKAGDTILTIEGPAQNILTAERVGLNYVSHLSAIATKTAEYVKAVESTKAKIVCTRKTLPGLRTLQKYAVKMGGGSNHRFGLDDAILIKDNHIAAAGGVSAVLDRAKTAGHTVKIEIEVDTLDQLSEVIKHGGADIVMLDNMKPEQLKKAVAMVDGNLITEASGGVNLKTVRAIAESGVDLISIGALTHSVTVLDIGLDFEN